MTKTKRRNMTNLKNEKGTPFGAPISTQDNGTTPEEKSEAEMLFDKIGTGAARAVKRPANSRTDRSLRRLIADANMEGDCIINDGSGYFRPGEDDEAAFEEYAAKERHRAREVLRKISRMEEAFNRRYQ